MADIKLAPRPIQLKWDAGHVVITPEDEDRFVKESVWAVGACQQKLANERLVDQLKNEFFPMVRQWCEQNSEKVRECYVTFGAGSMTMFAVTVSPRYDFSLSDALSDLEVRLFEKNWPAEVLQVPSGSNESLQTFLDPEKAIQVYGDPH